jgi:hypothetical protein
MQQTHDLSQQTIFWMQQALELSQQILNFRQRSFIVSIDMPICNQITIHGKKHTSITILNRYYCNAQLVAAIGTHKGTLHEKLALVTGVDCLW